NTVSVRAFDADPALPGSLLFAFGPPPAQRHPFERTTSLTMGGQTWSLGWNRLSDFPSVSKTPSAWGAGCSALLSLLLAGLVLILQTSARRSPDRLQLGQSALPLRTSAIQLASRTV